MYFSGVRRQGAASVRLVCAAVGGAVLAVSAWAQQVYLSGPSLARLQQPATYSGKNFSPNAALNVVVQDPGNGSAVFSAVSGADGSLQYTLVPTLAGAYTLSVQDAAGKTLATAVVAVLP